MYLASQHKASLNRLAFAYAIYYRHGLMQMSRYILRCLLLGSTGTNFRINWAVHQLPSLLAVEHLLYSLLDLDSSLINTSYIGKKPFIETWHQEPSNATYRFNI